MPAPLWNLCQICMCKPRYQEMLPAVHVCQGHSHAKLACVPAKDQPHGGNGCYREVLGLLATGLRSRVTFMQQLNRPNAMQSTQLKDCHWALI